MTLRSSGSLQRGHCGALQKGHVLQSWHNSRPVPSMSARLAESCHSPVWLRRLHPCGHSVATSQPDSTALETGEKAFELAKAAGQQIVHVTGLRDSRSKLVGQGIGIALHNRDPVDDVAKHTGGTHSRQAAADHERWWWACGSSSRMHVVDADGA